MEFTRVKDIFESSSATPSLGRRVVFKRVPRRKVPRLLNSIDGYVSNRRYKRVQFEKYLMSKKGIDRAAGSMFYGAFSASGKCLALAFLNSVPDGFTLIAEIQSVEKGYGKALLSNLSSMCPDLWLAADPNGGASLLRYYRNLGFFDEYVVAESKWAGGGQEHFFYKCSNAASKRRLLKFLDNTNVKTMSFPKSEWADLRGRRTVVTHRVSDDARKYRVGDMVKARLGGHGWTKFTIVGVKLVDSPEKSPYAEKLTPRQNSYLSNFRRIAVITLKRI